MFKLLDSSSDGMRLFSSLDAVKVYMTRLYRQGLIRGSQSMIAYGPKGEHVYLYLSFGVVMDTRARRNTKWLGL